MSSAGTPRSVIASRARRQLEPLVGEFGLNPNRTRAPSVIQESTELKIKESDLTT